MNHIEHRLRLDVLRDSVQGFVRVTKNDTRSRKIIVFLTEGSCAYPLYGVLTAKLKAEKPDGTILYNDCVVENAAIVYTITAQTTATVGIVECELVLYGDADEVLATPRFKIIVQDPVIDDSEIESTDEFTALTSAIQDAEEIKAPYTAGDGIDIFNKVVSVKKARSNTIGGIKAIAKTTETVPVAVDADGMAWVPQQSGGSGSSTGADGKSAYEIAVKNGYKGTEAEWLASLKGEKGEDGQDGADAPVSVDIRGILKGKRAVSFGDSIAAGVGNSDSDGNPYGYVQMIAERNGMTLHSYATGGAKMAEILAQLNSATETEADFVLLEGGYNDSTPGSVTDMGTLSSGYSASLDTATFCGALESLLKTAQEKYPCAKIVFVIVHRTRRNDWVSYAEVIQQACEKWSVPFVNLLQQGGLNANIAAMRTAFTDEVGVHPNKEGYLTWYVPPVEAKMREMISHIKQTSGPVDPDQPYTGVFDIPGVIPNGVQKISQYTVNGLSMEAGNMTVGSQTIALPALGKWDTLTATAEGAGAISRQSGKKPLSEFAWNVISSNDTTILFGTYEIIPIAGIPLDETTPPVEQLYCNAFEVRKFNDVYTSNRTYEGITSKTNGELRLRVLKSRLASEDAAGLTAYLTANDCYIVYKATEQTTESVTLDALTTISGAVTLTGGYKGGTMTAVEGDPVATASAYAKVEQTDDGAVITCKDANGTTTATIQHGHTPVKGTDYWTEADKAEIVQDVLAALPDGDEVSY